MKRYRLSTTTPAEERHWRYEARKSVGKCARCAVEARVPGQATCQNCKQAMVDGKRQAKALGLCQDCWKDPALPGKRFCAAHAEARKERQMQRYLLRRIRHLCVRCGKKRIYKGTTKCKEHLEQDRRGLQRRRSKDQSTGDRNDSSTGGPGINRQATETRPSDAI